MDWQRVKAGDVIPVPPGTVHAIGAGITLVEIQQNIDLTYRLYDYGRPRELHLDEGVEAARAEPYVLKQPFAPLAEGRTMLVRAGHFIIEQWSWTGTREIALPAGVQGWLIPIKGKGLADGAPWQGGECWLIENFCSLTVEPGQDLLFAYPGSTPLALFNQG